jgi:replicative DNA helicase
MTEPSAEQYVLGGMLSCNNHLEKGCALLTSDDFEHTNHKIIFSTISQAHKSNNSLSIYELMRELKKNSQSDKVGGPAYLYQLLAISDGIDFEYYCLEVRELATQRVIEKILINTLKDISTKQDSGKIIDSLSFQIEDIKKNKPKADSVYRYLLDPASESEIMEEIKNTSPGVRVGFKIGEIDLKIPGGALAIIAAPTGHGKTLAKINFLLNYLELHPEKQVYFFSYEESRAAIVTLFLNTYINRELSKNNRESIKSYFRDGSPQYISENARQDFSQKKEAFFNSLIESKRLNIFYSDYAVEELDQVIRFVRKNTNVGLVGIDYMQLLSLKKKQASRQEELKAICLILKDCAVATGLPIILSAQFNRTVVNEQTMSPLAIGESGDVERAANMVIGLFNREYDKMSISGNVGRTGKPIPKESAIYMEILKGRETGIGHSAVIDLNGNAGKLTAKEKNDQHHDISSIPNRIKGSK